MIVSVVCRLMLRRQAKFRARFFAWVFRVVRPFAAFTIEKFFTAIWTEAGHLAKLPGSYFIMALTTFEFDVTHPSVFASSQLAYFKWHRSKPSYIGHLAMRGSNDVNFKSIDGLLFHRFHFVYRPGPIAWPWF